MISDMQQDSVSLGSSASLCVNQRLVHPRWEASAPVHQTQQTQLRQHVVGPHGSNDGVVASHTTAPCAPTAATTTVAEDRWSRRTTSPPQQQQQQSVQQPFSSSSSGGVTGGGGVAVGAADPLSGSTGFGTIRYVGPLDADTVSDRLWVGVEWDDGPMFGRHDGMHNGKRYFKQRGTAGMPQRSPVNRNGHPDRVQQDPYRGVDTNGSGTDDVCSSAEARSSFLKVSSLPIHCLGCGFAESVVQRYTASLTHEERNDLEIIDCVTNQRKRIEFPGVEKVETFFKNLYQLRTLTLSRSLVSHAGEGADLNLRKVTSVRLDSCLLWQWEEVLKILKFLPSIETAAFDYNPLKFNNGPIPRTDAIYGESEQYRCLTLRELSLNGTDFDLADFKRLDELFPNLEVLSLCRNDYRVFPPGCFNNGGGVPLFRKLKTLKLQGNYFDDWKMVFHCLSYLPVSCLQLSENCLGDSFYDNCPQSQQPDPDPSRDGNDENRLPTIQSAHLEELFIDDNQISQWQSLHQITEKFPELKSFRWLGNPLCPRVTDLTNSDSSTALPRYLAIAVFAKLLHLNGAEVTRQERIVAERYFLSLVDCKDSKVEAVDPDMKHYNRLTAVHGEIRSVGGRGPFPGGPSDCNSSPNGGNPSENQTLSKKLILVILEPDATSIPKAKRGLVVSKKVPDALRVADLKALCARLFGIPSYKQRLMCVDDNSPTGFILDERFDLSFYRLTDGSRIRVQDLAYDDQRTNNS